MALLSTLGSQSVQGPGNSTENLMWGMHTKGLMNPITEAGRVLWEEEMVLKHRLSPRTMVGRYGKAGVLERV